MVASVLDTHLFLGSWHEFIIAKERIHARL
jgi:hypothetical protein